MLRIPVLLPVFLAIFAVNLSAQGISVHPGTEIPVELHTKLDTQLKVGTKIEFHTTEAVLIGHNIVVPENATVTGHIEQVIDGGRASSKSVLRIIINALKWKHGEAPLNAVISSVERNPAQEMLQARGRRFRNPPTFLKDIHIRAHLSRNAVTEFYSDHPSLTVSKGLFFLLRQVDPDHDPAMSGKDHVLDVGPEN